MKMKKIALSASLALLALGGVSTAMAQDTSGAGGFVTAQVGNAHWNALGEHVNRFDYGVSGGYRWALDANQSLGAELGYTNFGRIRGTAFGLVPYSVKGEGITLGANYRYNFQDPSIYLVGRAGYLRARVHENVPGYGHLNDYSNGYYVGAAVGYDFTPAFGMQVGYDYNRAKPFGGHANLNVVSVGAEYRF